MDRRAFLTARKQRQPDAVTPVSPPQLRGIQSGLTPYSGPWGTRQVAHLLKRTMFGAKKTDIDYFKSLTPGQAVTELLNVSATPPEPPVKNYDNTNIATTDPDYSLPQGQTWVNNITNDGTANSRRITSFKAWWTALMLDQDRTIREKMVLFWHNHFATETNDIGWATWCYRNNIMLRNYALGNFKQFVRAVTLDIGMLRYLNGNLNSNTAPDENYSRELQELFTLGKQNNPNYTEDDVKQAARVLTGWRIDNSTMTHFFQANRHDTGNKQFSSFYNNRIITGRSGATAGDLELNDLLDMIFSKNVEVSRFIVSKLYRFFCYYTIDAATQSNVIEPLAAIFRTIWEIKPVLDTLLKSEHFFDPLNQGCMIKTPLDTMVGMCREFNIQFPPSSDYVNAYFMWDYLRSQSSTSQLNIGDPPSVAGWPSYYQEPQYYEIWINSDTLPKRNRFTDQLVSPGYSRNNKKIQLDPVSFAKTLPNPADPNLLINDSLDILYAVPLSDATKAAIKKNILLSGQDQDYYWSNAWYAYVATPNDQMAYQTVYTRLRDLYKYFMNLPEYQLA
jgi:uncharacterized protein (DUF1800 family)